jgi:hypothetical protein
LQGAEGRGTTGTNAIAFTPALLCALSRLRPVAPTLAIPMTHEGIVAPEWTTSCHSAHDRPAFSCVELASALPHS